MDKGNEMQWNRDAFGVDFEGTREWTGYYRGVMVKVREHVGYGVGGRRETLCGYIYVTRKSFTPKCWAAMRDRRKVEYMLRDCVNGGVTWHQRITYWDVAPWRKDKTNSEVIEIGWDYTHSWDYNIPAFSQVVGHAVDAIDMLMEAIPDMKVWDAVSGEYVAPPAKEAGASP